MNIDLSSEGFVVLVAVGGVPCGVTNEEDEDELEENVEQVIKEMKIRKKKVIPADERRRIGLKPEEAKKSEN